MMEEIPEIVILYGTQGGTAKYASNELTYKLKMNKYSVKEEDLSTFDVMTLPNLNYVIFVVSTHGYGTPPSSCETFFNFIMRRDLPSILNDVNFTIFGLGDSSYEKFNYCAKILCARLKMLGANLFHPIGLGDDNHDFCFEGSLEPWSNELISNLNNNHFAFHSKIDNLPYDNPYSVQIEQDMTEQVDNLFNKKLKNKIINTQQLTEPSAVKQVVKVDIESKECINYSSGDIVLINPININKEDIKYLLSYFNLHEENFVSVYKEKKILLKVKAYDLFRKYIDINSIVKRRFCRIAKEYCDIPHQKEKLTLYSTVEGRGEFYFYADKERRTYIEMLKDFNGIKLPLNIFINEVGFITPREFSISSYQKDKTNHFEITLGIIDYFTEYKRRKIGLFSQMVLNILKDNSSEREIMIEIRKGKMKQVSIEKDELIIATGTGITPIRSYLIERNMTKTKGKIILIYGCRDKDKDYLYKEEFEQRTQFYSNLNIELYNAFSREGNNKYYVQNVIIDKSNVIIPFVMSDNCERITLVGNAKFLPRAIKMAFTKGITKEKGLSEEEAEKLFKNTIENKMYIESW